MDPLLLVLGFLLLAYLLAGIRQINQWEVALRFTLGKLSGRVEPGVTLFLPGFQSLRKIDTRTKNRDLLRQMVITRDNVTTMVDTVLYYRVVDPEKATLAVENYEAAVKDRAKVVLRDVVGETRLDELLAHREEVAAKVRAQVETTVSQWGLHVELIGLQDVQLPPQMQEVLAKVAIAERDRKYVVIKSEADVESAKNFAEAATILSKSPGAMELRRFEALANLSQGNTKVIFDLAKPYDDVRHTAAAMAEAATTEPQRVRVDNPGAGALRTASQHEAEAIAEAEAELQARKFMASGRKI
ncbi:SPFH domain-containing protein [Polyangium jinanense]|uniref:Slipin family protein n=1 Tax=Polyangium jinanense TaxID=2829994 RepID=A0A9X4ANR2_9BACT|nr:SPFH domain-containing protein [Polyangium jinanense]MDC3953630.1 slipin family protein [Polyangium jinanense]MDC3979249.1 slipin family protein [Polyangium jinanense]